ncbi:MULTISPECIES: hypothetical protein [Actinomadura]|uniref:Uncharacterized protein n=1 Tax=Actinomadura chibensis TaxID=392828 RepID=A0A5D0N987_9ACTN|nr:MULTISPECIES: hypothetical protein [Actinomadura]TYB40867.1 hypothetical protein FXF69_38310 [Actinomadura chibensis]
MAPTKSADPQRIALHGKDITDVVVPRLTNAGNALNSDGTYNLEGGDFSIACTGASTAYPIAIQFAFEDTKLLIDTAQDFAKKIGAAAENYAKAEQSSTLV